MAVSGKAPELVLREGEGTACGDEACLTLEGAFDRVKAAFQEHHPNGDVALLVRAFNVGRDMHATQLRKSGEPYFFHPLAVAQSLAVKLYVNKTALLFCFFYNNPVMAILSMWS